MCVRETRREKPENEKREREREREGEGKYVCACEGGRERVRGIRTRMTRMTGCGYHGCSKAFASCALTRNRAFGCFAVSCKDRADMSLWAVRAGAAKGTHAEEMPFAFSVQLNQHKKPFIFQVRRSHRTWSRLPVNRAPTSNLLPLSSSNL
jgi:hypothetical protein